MAFWDKNSKPNRFPVNKQQGSRDSHRWPKKRKKTRFRNVNEEQKFIFIHVPKTGGSSIENMLWNRYLDSEHKPFREYMHCDRYKNYFTFGFVRNPYLRAISMFTYFKSGHNQKRWKIHALFEKFDGLDGFMDYFLKTDDAWFRKHEFFKHFKQTDYLLDVKHKIGFIGKFEHFERDLMHLMKILDLNIKTIPHDNNSGLYRHNKYDKEVIVTPTFVEFINDYLSKDFTEFNYTKIHLKAPVTLKSFKSMISIDN
eukprot:61844_1